MDIPKYNHPPFVELDKLCKMLRISRTELENILSSPSDVRYKDPKTTAYKKDGSIRKIKCPLKELRSIQEKINNNIFKTGFYWPKYLFGSIPKKAALSNRDYVSCVSLHCRAKSICKIDISNFFDNVHISLVKSVFKNLCHFSDEVTDVLADLCCYNDFLVQGALTSSYLATLILWDKEPELVENLKKKGLVYTRLVDDITISSRISNYNFDIATKRVEVMLLEKDLPINKSKYEYNYLSIEPLTVHGLRVSFDKPKLPKHESSNIRASVKNLENLAQLDSARTKMWFRTDYNRCMGRVNKLARVKNQKHQALVERLKVIEPLPSINDIKYARLRLKNLEADYSTKKKTFNYKKRYYKLNQRIHLISKTYPDVAKKIRESLKEVPPDEKPI
ncbi:reverse transcriptase family protein [Colwellia sp. D2M02]|uniref:reverse transcriptase family protein n=1 Tax=Colwellia sp. D2M02 TaxID=2841562 RepID=UPI001C0954CE|nr:reverse transcriptase family protein [Colwellia sp. D2M02]MBU2893714.1 reverse transcriptase family protein [Colwellia sp. D2M02]